jgi:DNA-directed RNA polymerase specialized sigma24 family protein
MTNTTARESISDLSGNEGTAPCLEISDTRLGPESAFLQDERSRILFAAIDKLPPGMRKAIELRGCETGKFAKPL